MYGCAIKYAYITSWPITISYEIPVTFGIINAPYFGYINLWKRIWC